MERSSPPPADLEIHVERTLESGKDALRYQLSSPSGVVPYQYQTFQGEAMLGSPEAFEKELREQMHRLGSGLDVEGQRLLESEIPEELETLGQRLYEQLFPKTLRDAYRRFRHSVETILVVTDQHWIPWELIKPFDDSDPNDPIDDDFLCLQFQLTRWLPGEVEHAAAMLRIAAVVHIVPDPQLPGAAKEAAALERLADAGHPDVSLRSLPQAEHLDVVELIRSGDVDLFHFSGHGDVPEQPDEARLELRGRPLRARQLAGALLTEIRKRRPMVVLNSCWSACQGFLLTGLGGWVEAWVRRGRCGAMIGSLWTVRSELAAAFAETLYDDLRQGASLGTATRAARLRLRNEFPGHPAWLTYAVYGHPETRVLLGALEPPASRETPARVDLSRLPLSTTPFEGRIEELGFLREAMSQPGVGIVSVVGFGGIGKSALTRELVEQLAPGYGGAETVFAWSFFSQGSQATATTSAEFVEAALRFVRPGVRPPRDEGERVRALARALQGQRLFLILDGVEPLQNPPNVRDGCFRDRGLRDLLLALARSGVEGLVMVTSRQPLIELERYATHRRLDLGRLDEPSGTALLRRLEVRGGRAALAEVVGMLDGHALALVLLGRLLANEYGGDVGQSRFAITAAMRSEDAAALAADAPQIRHVHRVLSRYEELWGEDAPERTFLALLGLLDRPMANAELVALLDQAVAAADLPRPPSRAFHRLVSRLSRAGLLVCGAEVYDTHPLIRSWFGERFRAAQGERFRDAQRVLFDYFRNLPAVEEPSTLVELEPLYRAVVHGCEGGLAEQAWKLLGERIRRGVEYSLYQLGAFGLELVALGAFFPDGWSEPPRTPIDEEKRASLLNDAAYCLLSLTRMHEAIAVLEAHVPVAERLGDRESLVHIYRHLVEARTACGELDYALNAAEKQVEQAEAVGVAADPGWAYADRGYVLYHMGRFAAARRDFARAEERVDPGHRPLVGYAGFQLCELLLACGDWQEALARAEHGLDFCASHDQRVLHRALFLMVLGRALLRAGRRDEGLGALAQARSAARQAAEETLAHVLTMSADEYCREGLLQLCDDCLDEARNLIDDAGMDLLRVDIWRIEARLALTRGDMTTAQQRWEIASRGVETTGYKLRAAELEQIREQFYSQEQRTGKAR